MNDWKDRELGMDRGITRRDFLNGVALAVGAAILPSDLPAATVIPPGAEKSPDYYPPALTGLRGSHPGSFDAAHSLRDGTFWDQAGKPSDWRNLRSGCGRRRHQRAFRGTFLPPGGGAEGARTRPRQPRRLRRTRQAQRVPLRPADHAGFRRNIFHREPCPVQCSSQGSDPRIGNRCSVVSPIRIERSISFFGTGTEYFFRQRNVWFRQTGSQPGAA